MTNYKLPVQQCFLDSGTQLLASCRDPFPERKQTKRNSPWELERSFGDSLSPLHSTTHPFPCDCWIHGWLKVRHFADVPTTDTSSTPTLPSKEELATPQFLKQTWDKVNSTKALPCLDIRKAAKSGTNTGGAYHQSELIGRGTSPAVKRISLKIRNLKQDQSILQLSSL